MGDLYMRRESRQQGDIERVEMSDSHPSAGSGSSDTYEEILKDMARFEAGRKRFFWGTLAIMLIILTWLIYELNTTGGFDGLF